jgi:hypothetical protein
MTMIQHCNSVAHELARYGSTQGASVFWFSDPRFREPLFSNKVAKSLKRKGENEKNLFPVYIMVRLVRSN